VAASTALSRSVKITDWVASDRFAGQEANSGS